MEVCRKQAGLIEFRYSPVEEKKVRLEVLQYRILVGTAKLVAQANGDHELQDMVREYERMVRENGDEIPV